MRVLVACECSGTVRDAFKARGHDAWSCDIQPSTTPGQHIQGDVLRVIEDNWDLIIAHPPCTYLTVANNGPMANGCSLYTAEQAKVYRADAVAFFLRVANTKCPKVAIENPVGIMSRLYRKPDQIIQPWHFGDDASKKTCLWLKGLPKLISTNRLPGDDKTRRANQTPSGQNKLAPSPERSKLRSITYPGIAKAMAEQWGLLDD